MTGVNNISKIIERLFLSTFLPHIVSSTSYDPLQSAYRAHHSTEHALLHTLDHIYKAADSGLPTLLVSLDLSAAFDSIDHKTLIDRLHKSFGISGTVLAWLQSYLSHRTQSVHIGSATSKPVMLDSGVPQGSVLGPILFTAYISPIAHIVANHNILHQQYADDSQLFISLSPSNPQPNISQLELCLTSLQSWFCYNGLALNASKSDAILFGTHQRLRSCTTISTISVAGTHIPLSDHITTLGVTLDKSLTLNNHVSAICKSSYFHIKALRHIRTSLPEDLSIALATAFVQSRLDYANSILYKTSSANLSKLQHVQNTLCRIIFQTQSAPASSLIHNLHWLPVKHRINFKIATITYKLLSNQQPLYLANLLNDYQPTRTLRSSSEQLLHQPRTATVFGSRAFSSAAPAIWNSIPLHIRNSTSLASFKRQLKTHYFTSD